MEVTRHLITIGLLGAMLLGSAAADIMIQPGYEQKSYETQVPDDSEQVPTEGPSSREQESELAREFERYRKLHRAIEGELVHLIHEQSSQNLQQMAPEVGAVPMNFRHRIIRPLQRRLGGIRSFYLTPTGDYGLHPDGYGFGSHPHTYRQFEEEPFPQQDYDAAARTQWTRSVDGGPGMDNGVAGDVQIVATQSTLDADGVDRVIELQVPEITDTEEATVDKLVEPRQIGYRDDAIVGSPLDRNHYENPHDNRDQHHPTESTEISSNLMKAANAVGNIIDSVAPRVMNHENGDSASTMTRHEDPAPNYRHDSQYPPSSENGQRTGDTSIWKAPTVSTNSQPMTGQSYNSRQHPQNSGWSSIPPTQSSHAPKASSKVHYSQKFPAFYPALSNPINNKNWLTTIHSYYPSYPIYRPDYQSYHALPPIGSYRPHVNGPSPYPSGATSSASASVNNPGFGNAPSHSSDGFNYPSGAHSSATASANNQSGFGSGPSSYNHGSHYPNGATSSASASANNPGFGNAPSHYSDGFNYPSGAHSSATASANNQSGFGSGPSSCNHGSHYPNGATSNAAPCANNNPGFGNGYSPYSYGSPYANSATASAIANSGNYGYNYPHRSSWNNAYGAQNPHASTNFVDQFGRTLFSVIPSSFNSPSTNPANYQEYLRNFIHN